MASGDLIARSGGSWTYALIDAGDATATSNGVWVDCAENAVAIILLTGSTAALVAEIDGANDLNKPLNTFHGVALGTSTAGQNFLLGIPCLPRWIKARVTTGGAAGTIQCNAVLRNFAPA